MSQPMMRRPLYTPRGDNDPRVPLSPRSLEDICVAPQADEMRWDLEPAPDVPYISDLETIVDVTIESRAYRELLLIALEQFADLQKRHEIAQRANRELRLRTRERARHDLHR